MKKTLILLATGLLVLGACSKNVTVKNPITISSPTPTVAITKVDLNETLEALGVKKAFQAGQAQFTDMFEPKPGYYYWIDKVIQKARISVTEWGTEAALPEKTLEFYAHHPFAYVIGERTSGTILFEGVFTGK